MAVETDTAATTAATTTATTIGIAAGERAIPSTFLIHSIEKLGGTMATGRAYYNSWQFRLVRILKENDLLIVVTKVPTEQATPAAGVSSNPASKAPTVSPELAEFRVKDNQAFTIITLNIKDVQTPHIQRCETAKQAWKALRVVHQGRGANGRMVLTQRLWSRRQQEGEDMASHLKEIQGPANQIANLSMGNDSTQIQGVDLVSMLSLSRPDSYEPLIMALQSRGEELTFYFMAWRQLQESTCRQAANTNGNGRNNGQSAFIARTGRFGGRGGNFWGNKLQRKARFNVWGGSNFGVVDVT